MIICHCNRITDKDILSVAEKCMADKDRKGPLRSNQIYRGCGARAKCGCCRPMIEALLLDNGYEVTIAKPDEIDRLRVRRLVPTE